MSMVRVIGYADFPVVAPGSRVSMGWVGLVVQRW
jgi:hypothetical protein